MNKIKMELNEWIADGRKPSKFVCTTETLHLLKQETILPPESADIQKVFGLEVVIWDSPKLYKWRLE